MAPLIELASIPVAERWTETKVFRLGRQHRTASSQENLWRGACRIVETNRMTKTVLTLLRLLPTVALSSPRSKMSAEDSLVPLIPHVRVEVLQYLYGRCRRSARITLTCLRRYPDCLGSRCSSPQGNNAIGCGRYPRRSQDSLDRLCLRVQPAGSATSPPPSKPTFVTRLFRDLNVPQRCFSSSSVLAGPSVPIDRSFLCDHTVLTEVL
jgi:hypothetical protein